jgi:hypothetical protein
MITLVYGNDWIGLYRDGILLDEGHSLSPYHILTALGLEMEEKTANEDWLEEEGSLPGCLEDVVLAGERKL